MTASTRPDTCAPTSTVPRADRVPFAVTWAAIGPRPTVTVWKVIGVGPFAHGFLTSKKAAPPAIRPSTTILGIQRLRLTMPRVLLPFEPSIARALQIVAERS